MDADKGVFQAHWRQSLKEENDRNRKREQYTKLKAKKEKGKLNRDECMKLNEKKVKHAEAQRRYHAKNAVKKKHAAADMQQEQSEQTIATSPATQQPESSAILTREECIAARG